MEILLIYFTSIECGVSPTEGESENELVKTNTNVESKNFRHSDKMC